MLYIIAELKTSPSRNKKLFLEFKNILFGGQTLKDVLNHGK